MKKKPKPENRPQAGQIEAIERHLERGEVAAAQQRLARLNAAYPGFKPLYRLAYEIACATGSRAREVFAAWQWGAASPNSKAAFEALAESAGPEFPYLYLHALERLNELGEDFKHEIDTLRAGFLDPLSEDEGQRLDLCRVLLGNEKPAEARALVESINLPEAQNNVGQAFFLEGKIAEAEAVWAGVVASAPDDAFALARLFAVRLWLAGKAAAAPLAERVLALAPEDCDDVSCQLDVAIMSDQLTAADAIYLAVLAAPWFAAGADFASLDLARTRLHQAGALIAWRLGRHDEAMARLDRIDDADDGDGSDALFDLREQLTLCRLSGDTPDWGVGQMSQWWPLVHLLALHPEKFASDDEVFERWHAPMPHADYLAAVALNGGQGANALGVAGLRYLVRSGAAQSEAAGQALISLLALPCGPDAVRSELHRWLGQIGLLDKEAPVAMLVGGKLTELRPFELTIHSDAVEEETVLSAADHRTYMKVIDLMGSRNIAKALPLMEDLLRRYPDYGRVLTTVATLREAAGEPIERWAPLVRHAVDVDPDYSFARTGMVKVLAREGQLDAARDQLKPLLELKEMHSSEWRSLLLAQIEIAKAELDLPTLMRLNTMLRDCLERFG
ncbi:MAG: hypothetical protein ABI478_03605 [Propionivibrio sp.]